MMKSFHHQSVCISAFTLSNFFSSGQSILFILFFQFRESYDFNYWLINFLIFQIIVHTAVINYYLVNKMGGLEMCSSCLNKQGSNDGDLYEFQVFRKIPFFGALKDYHKLIKGNLAQKGGNLFNTIGTFIGPSVPALPNPQNPNFPSLPASLDPTKLINLKPLETFKGVGSIFDLVGDQTFVKKIKKSKYSQIVESLKGKEQKFTDAQFGPNQTSLGKVPNLDLSKVKWLRVHQMLKNPVFINESIHPDDILQGSLGDCYFLSAMASLAEQDYRVKNIFTSLQISANGVYMARVLFNGVYQQVVIDDYFPANQKGQPLFAKPAGKCQIWVMVLQKCWAKLYGSFAEIIGGLPHQVSHAFSSAPVFLKSIPKDDKKRQTLWSELVQDQKNGALFCCGTINDQNIEKLGFVKGHAYSILGIYEKPFRLIKLRNPWGFKQWQGRASDHDLDFWNQVTAPDKQALDYEDSKRKKDKDGVFFMVWEDFLNYFSLVDICKINDNAHYNFLQVEFQNLSPKMFEFQVRGTQATLTFAVTQPGKRGTKTQSYSRSFLALGKWDEATNSYKYVKSNSSNRMADNYLQIKQASAGKYVLYSKYLWNHGSTTKAVVSIYSVSPAQLTEIKTQITSQNFINQIFLDHASKNPRRKQYNDKGYWICSEILLNEGGFSYFVTSVNKQSKAKVGVTVNQAEYVQRKLQLQPSLKGCKVLQQEVTASKPLVVVAQLLVSVFPEKITNPSPTIKNLE